jgi:subtilase family serine protease
VFKNQSGSLASRKKPDKQAVRMKKNVISSCRIVLCAVIAFSLLSVQLCAQSGEIVVRFKNSTQTMVDQIPEGLNISSQHQPYNILVLDKSGPLSSEAFNKFIRHPEILRIEYGYTDEAGSPVYPTGDVIIEPEAGLELMCLAYLREKNIVVKNNLEQLHWIVATLPATITWQEFESEALSSGLIKQVMRDEIIIAHQHSNDPLYSTSWHISQFTDKDIDADLAWSVMPSNTTIKTVAVIDGHGFDTAHPDLTGQWADTFNAVDLTTNIGIVNASEKHATACAGIPGGTYNNGIGVPGLGGGFLNVQAIKIGYNPSVTGSFSTSSTIQAAAINRAMSVSSTVCISMSFGSTTYQTAFYNAITQARLQGRNGAGLVIFGSSGNNGISTWTNYPASYDGVVAVGSTTIADNRSSFSNFGSGLELSAPGSGISTTDVSGSTGYNTTDYTNFSGTSAACPVAASVAAMMLAANPQLSETEVKSILAQSCEKVGNYVYTDNEANTYSSWSNELGYGRVNMHAAVLLALQSATPLPDVQLTAAQVSNTVVNVGQTITASVNQNINPATGNAVFPVVEYRWSTDQTWSADDVTLGTDGSTLAAGNAAEGESLSFVVPAGTGTQYLLMKADVSNAVDESNENNNVITLAITVNPAPVLPDITLTNFTANDLTPDVGQTIVISCNQIISAAPTAPATATIQYRYSTDQVWSSGDIVIGTDISSFNSTTMSESENISFTIPSGSGTRYVLVKVDVNGQIAESNENNNTYILILNVNAPVIPPDIFITQLTTSNTAVSEQQNINVLFQQTMVNAPALAVTAGYECRWSSDLLWSSDDSIVSTGLSTFSTSNNSETESVLFAVPQGIGTKNLLIMADALNQYVESNENNLVTLTFTVSPAAVLPDVFIDATSISSSVASVGQTLTINCDQNISLPNFSTVNVFMEYRWATTTSYSTSFPILGVDFSSVGGGDAEDPENLIFTVPAGTGQRYLLIVCDTGNNVVESNESNNIIVIPVNVVSTMAVGNTNDDSIAITDKVNVEEADQQTVAVDDANTGRLFNIYPIPASEYVFIEADAMHNATAVSIYNIAGQKIIEETLNGGMMKRLDVSTLQSGNYIIVLYGENILETHPLLIVR